MLSNGDGKQRLVEEWSEDEVTFVPDAKKKKKRKVKRQGGDVETGWCKRCVTEAKASGGEMGSWKSPGQCEARGCPGYKSQLPSTGPQGEPSDESSDEAPLLFSPLTSPSCQENCQELDMMDHCHVNEPKREKNKKARRQLAMATLLCSLFVTGEVVGGWVSGSLAIMSDAAHMFSDLASFGVSLLVLYIAERRPTKKMTFGYHRAEALGALATLIIIWYVTGILVYLAIKRIHDSDFEIHGTAMVIVASCAVAFNILLGVILHGACGLGHHHGHSHGGGAVKHQHSHGANEQHINIRAALIHVLGDLLQSIGVLISSVLITVFGDSFKIADPICTLIFAAIVVVTTLTVLRDTLAILLEGAPTGVSYDGIIGDLSGLAGVVSVHSLHIWSLTADIPVLSVHLTLKEEADTARVRGEAIRLLRSKHNIFRSTVQVESHEASVMAECDKCQPLLP